MNTRNRGKLDCALLDSFDLVRISTEDLDVGGQFTRNLAAINGIMSFRIRDGQDVLANQAISMQAMRREGSLTPCYNADHYGIDITVIGKGQPQLYGFVRMLEGGMQMVAGPNGTADAHGAMGIVARGLPGTRLLTTENNVRQVLWVDAGRLERTLATWNGEPLSRSLEFVPTIDWNAEPVGALRRMIEHLEQELRDPRGLTTEPVALETFTDLLVQTILVRVQHNYSARMARPNRVAIPAYLHRAEAFMHASADRPIRLADVAAAAGCSLSQLQATFRRFRDTTALDALHKIRLHCAREALLKASDDEPNRVIARRFGFTNPSRFIAAYGQCFGEHPRETRRKVQIGSLIS